MMDEDAEHLIETESIMLDTKGSKSKLGHYFVLSHPLVINQSSERSRQTYKFITARQQPVHNRHIRDPSKAPWKSSR
jgi:hypothetical protein